MTHTQARGYITARIAALAVSSSYAASSFALGDITWAEAPFPLVPEYEPQPDTLAPLAFWADNRQLGYLGQPGAIGGHGFAYVTGPVMVRFLYPLRELGPPNSDWDRAVYALEALVDTLQDRTWYEAAGDGSLVVSVDPSLGPARARFVGAGWVVWEHPFRVHYERNA